MNAWGNLKSPFHRYLPGEWGFFQLGFTPCNTEQPLQDMEIQEKETQKD